MISVLMTTYNGEQYIRKQIYSILNQDFNDFELLIFDDCSVDNTQSIIKEIQKCDNRIKFFINNKRLGYSKNFLHGLDRCNGDYIFFADQDDIWKENKISKTLALIQKNKKVNLFITGETKIYNEENINKSYKDSSKRTKKLKFKDLIYYCSYQGCNMCISKSFANVLKYDKNDEIKGHDWFISILAAIEGNCYLNKTSLMYHRIHVGSVTRKQELNKYDYKRMVLRRQLQSLIWGKKYLERRLRDSRNYKKYVDIEKFIFLKFYFLIADKACFVLFVKCLLFSVRLLINPITVLNLIYLKFCCKE